MTGMNTHAAEKPDVTAIIIDLLQRGHAVQFRAHGDSMHPVIRPDDALHVEPVRSVRVGEVVLTLADRGLTAHRVIAVQEQMIVTRGDNTPAADPPISITRILGRVTHVERSGERRSVAAEPRMVQALRRLRRSLSHDS